jgi:diguanylate cyclase (GGDEF)-like protein
MNDTLVTPGGPAAAGTAASTVPCWQSAMASLLPAVLAARGNLLAVKELASGRLVHVNAAMAHFLGRAEADLLGRTDAEVFDPLLATTLRAAEQTSLAQREPFTSEHHFEHAGRRHAFEVLRLVVPTAGRPGAGWLCAVWTDLAPAQQQQEQLRVALAQIEQQQRAHEALRRELADQALRDAASGLYSRAHFDDQFKRELDLSTREHREFALVFVQLDALLPEVAARGAAAQARILEALGRLLRSGTRAMDASCRFDENLFAVLLSGVGLATAHARMESLRRQCATQIVVHDGHELRFSVAMGVASFPHTAQSQEALLAASRAALTEARRRGGNHVTLAAIRLDPVA